MNTLTIDIETRPSDEMPERAKAPGNLKKKESIEAYETNSDNIMKDYRKQSLDSTKGNIVSIAYKFNDHKTKAICGDKDELILEEFERVLLNLIERNDPLLWVGHNIKEFDLPFIYHRCLKNGIKGLPLMLPKRDLIFDTMKEFNPFQYRPTFISLDNICEFLGIEQKKSNVKGSTVFDFYLDNMLDEIAQYNMFDVDDTYEVYKRLKRY